MKTCFRSSQLYILDRDRYPDEGKKEGKTKMAEKAKDTTAVVKVEKLPENWDSLSLEEKYRLVNKKLHKLADIDNDWDIDIKLQTFRDDGFYSYIEWTDASCVLDDDDARFRPCQFVRKEPVEFGKVVLADFPPELREALGNEDWTGEDDGDIPNIFESRVEGKNWTECLEKNFIRLELLKLGYEMCWECTEYREVHREFFAKYFETMDGLFGSDDDEEDSSGNNIKIDLDGLRELLREEKKKSGDDDSDRDDGDFNSIVIE
ncbi:hypothetical protein J5690_04365 [bacterium]|nr:hypothetical protein [bacterium]